MPYKKKSFNKANTQKFLLLRGSSQAVNADGETLENILVPVSKNYKPGTSLLMSNIASVSCLEPDDEEVQKEHIGEDFHCNDSDIFADASTENDSDAEDTVENLLGDLKKLKCTKSSNKSNLYDHFENSELLATISHDDSVRSGPKRDDQYRVESLKMFNEKFDDVLEEYDDDDIGSLEGDNDTFDLRTASPEPFTHDFEDHQKESELVLGDYDREMKEKILNYAENSGKEKMVKIVIEKPLEFDCESIRSTYSNKYNHPTVIREEKPQRSRKTSNTSHTERDSEDESHYKVLLNSSNIRKKDETPEEKKERQRKFKEAKRLRRELKKQNKEAFKEAKKLHTLNANQNTVMKLA